MAWDADELMTVLEILVDYEWVRAWCNHQQVMRGSARLFLSFMNVPALVAMIHIYEVVYIVFYTEIISQS
jgi:hypothetical protein